MSVLQFLMLLAVSGGLVSLLSYFFFSLLKSAQGREDAEDERLWHYLLDPRAL